MQKYTPPQAYILGRKWQYRKNSKKISGNGWFDRPGIIDYENIDNYYEHLSIEAINWIRDVRSDGHTWSVDPPSRLELYPNMKNTIDSPWKSVKKEIADDIGEITQVWMCGTKQRNIAISKGVTSWRDPRLSAELMDITGAKTSSIVNAILNTNRGTDDYNPKYLDEPLPRHDIEFFVDFETINEIVDPIDDKFPQTINETYLFMIGIGWRTSGKSQWIYKHFTTKYIDFAGNFERDNLIAFHKYIIEILDKHNTRDYIIYHWSQAEPRIYKDMVHKYDLEYSDMLNNRWFDLLAVFKNNIITIRGAFNYGLKSIAKALYDLDYINTYWEDNGIVDGLNAMVKALECSDDAKKRNIHMEKTPIMKHIIKYNETDCRMLLEILDFIRFHMVKPEPRCSQRIKKRKRSISAATDSS
jgi:hypothetical protein